MARREPAKPRRQPADARRARGAASRQRIRDAAIALVSERGVAATSVGEICERAGVAKTALYWHFGSKEGLLADLMQEVGTHWIEAIQKQVYLEGDPFQRVERLVGGWRQILEAEPQLIRLPMVLQLEQGEASAERREALLRVLRRAEDALVQGIHDTLGCEIESPELVAQTILALLQGALLRLVVDPEGADLDRTFAELRRTILLVMWDRLPDEKRAELERLALRR